MTQAKCYEEIKILSRRCRGLGNEQEDLWMEKWIKTDPYRVKVLHMEIVERRKTALQCGFQFQLD